MAYDLRPGLTNAGLIRSGIPNRSPDVATALYSDPDDGGDGSYHMNPLKDQVAWRWRVAQLHQGGLACALPASGAPQDVIVDFGAQGAGGGDSEIAYFFALETTGHRRFAVRPKIGPPLNKYLSNVPISSELVFGTSQLPGYLPSSIYAYANSDLNFHAQALGNALLSVNMGVYCRAWGDDDAQAEARRKAHEGAYLPIWIGPENKANPSLTGPEVTIPPGGTVKLRFPALYDADYIAAWILDDSSSTTGVEPVLSAIIQEEDTRERLIDIPTGISWRDFLACPTTTVSGMPNGGVIRAMSLKSPRGGWTHRIPRKSGLEVQLISGDAGTITFRGALLGWYVDAPEETAPR